MNTRRPTGQPNQRRPQRPQARSAGSDGLRRWFPVVITGAILAAAIILVIAKGQKGGYTIDNTQAGAFAANGYGDHSPGKYTMTSADIAATEASLTNFPLFKQVQASIATAAAGTIGM